MELEFGKHFKDATNILLMMDHDSGYVEGSDNYMSNHDSDIYKDSSKQGNFYHSEDALLEQPDIFKNSENFRLQGNEDGDTLRFSPDIIIDSSVKSSQSTLYSGLESECNSEPSLEIPLQNPIVIGDNSISPEKSNMDQHDSRVSVSDMSLESSTYDSMIIEKANVSDIGNNDSVISQFKGFPLTEDKYTNNSNDLPNSSINLISNMSLSETQPDSTNTVFIEPECPDGKSSSYGNSNLSIKEKKRLTLVFSRNSKENEYQVKRKYPSLTPEKKYEEPLSPDIFGDETENTVDIETQTSDFPKITTSLNKNDELYVSKLDHRLLKRAQTGLSGVLPPPSVTLVNLSFAEILDRLHQNKQFFWNSKTEVEPSFVEENKNTSLNSSGDSSTCSNSLLVNTEYSDSFPKECWPDILNVRYHGLHHNRSKLSEEIESLCEKYQKRCVGAETQSTCTVFEVQMSSPTKRRLSKPRWGGKSPGRRLSHLARRRITFSNANLQAGGSSLAGSRARQILCDARKMGVLNRRKSPRKTPKKTPSKSPKNKTRTPSSSAKKKLAMRFRMLSGEFETSVPSSSGITSAHKNTNSPSKGTKRALFQSPNRDKNSSLKAANSQSLLTSTEKSKLRRALFSSPRKNSPLKYKKSPFKQALRFGNDKKRKRNDSDEIPPSKFPRSMSMDVKTTNSASKPMFRAQSELNVSLNKSQSPYELTDAHKKKLQWAVYGALQTQNIIKGHPQWKIFAAVLGRVTRYFFTHQVNSSMAAGAKLEGGTTDRMNRIARVHVLSVIKGKTADEIIVEYLKSRPRVQKPQGYVAPENYNSIPKKVNSESKEGVLQDRVNTMDSWERTRADHMTKPSTTENRIDRIRKVINFGDDR